MRHSWFHSLSCVNWFSFIIGELMPYQPILNVTVTKYSKYNKMCDKRMNE